MVLRLRDIKVEEVARKRRHPWFRQEHLERGRNFRRERGCPLGIEGAPAHARGGARARGRGHAQRGRVARSRLPAPAQGHPNHLQVHDRCRRTVAIRTGEHGGERTQQPARESSQVQVSRGAEMPDTGTRTGTTCTSTRPHDAGACGGPRARRRPYMWEAKKNLKTVCDIGARGLVGAAAAMFILF
jgi:ribosomal protein L37E